VGTLLCLAGITNWLGYAAAASALKSQNMHPFQEGLTLWLEGETGSVFAEK
jgi:hypothetical protein